LVFIKHFPGLHEAFSVYSTGLHEGKFWDNGLNSRKKGKRKVEKGTVLWALMDEVTDVSTQEMLITFIVL